MCKLVNFFSRWVWVVFWNGSWKRHQSLSVSRPIGKG